MKVNLYARICEALDILIEDFECGDIGLPVFASKVERIMGNKSLADITPEYGFEWEVVATGFNLIYTSAQHNARMTIRTTADGSRYVHAMIKFDEDAGDDEDTGDDDSGDGDEDNAGPSHPEGLSLFEAIGAAIELAKTKARENGGCGDPECQNCNGAEERADSKVQAALEKSLEKSGVKLTALKLDGQLIPPGMLLSFGPLKRDEN